MPVVATAGGLPTRLGKYEILMQLALGGMARIYIGRTTGIGSFERHVVLKLITPERANDHTAVQMFLDEARLAAALNHQNVAQVFEVGEDGGVHYLAMEYVHGQDLRALLAKAGSQGTRVPLELALTCVTGAAAGLHHAHERRGQDGVPLGIVHRDVSPSNIMVGYDGSVKLLDFGIAKATQRSIETQAGVIKGKFAYMAPEQCRGRDVDRRSDVFSLGIILYEITTQHRCFRADSDFDTMHRIVTGDVVRPTRLIQGYPQALEAIVMKALALDPSQRYQSAGALLEALESFAVAARMSLSTMSLGRFMRDMFGDLTEPWLTKQGRATQPPPRRESTISNTSATGSDVVHQRAKTPLAVELSPPQQQSSRTVIDLPRTDSPDPTMHPAPQPPPQPTPDPRVGRTSSPVVPAGQNPQQSAQQSQPPPHAPTGQQSRQAMPPGPSTPAHGSQPIRVHQGPRYGPHLQHNPIPQGAFPQGPGSGSPPSNSFDDDDDLQFRPNRRPLFIGFGIAGVGLIFLLAMTLGDDDRAAKEQPIIMDDKWSVSGSGAATGSGAPSGETPVVDQSITIDIKTEPYGADVILAGNVIGTTPLEIKRPKGKGMSMITVHKARYIDVTMRIDLADDFTSVLELKPAEAPVRHDTKKAPGSTSMTDANNNSGTGTTTNTVKNPDTKKNP